MDEALLEGLYFDEYATRYDITLFNGAGDVLCTLPSEVKSLLQLKELSTFKPEFRPYLDELVTAIQLHFINDVLSKDAEIFEKPEEKEIINGIKRRSSLVPFDLELLRGTYDQPNGGYHGWATGLISNGAFIVFRGQKVFNGKP